MFAMNIAAELLGNFTTLLKRQKYVNILTGESDRPGMVRVTADHDAGAKGNGRMPKAISKARYEEAARSCESAACKDNRPDNKVQTVKETVDAHPKNGAAKAESELHGGAAVVPVPIRDYHKKPAKKVDGKANKGKAKPVKASNAGILHMSTFSAKAIIVTGETYSHRKRIKGAVPKARAIWHRKAGGWIFAKQHEVALREALSDLLAA